MTTQEIDAIVILGACTVTAALLMAHSAWLRRRGRKRADDHLKRLR